MKSKLKFSWVWCFRSVIPALGKREDHKFKNSLSYTERSGKLELHARPCLKK
jgi:hypothetical protein